MQEETQGETREAVVAEGPFTMSIGWVDGVTDDDKLAQINLIKNMIEEFNKLANSGTVPEVFKTVSFTRI